MLLVVLEFGEHDCGEYSEYGHDEEYFHAGEGGVGGSVGVFCFLSFLGHRRNHFSVYRSL